MKNEAHINTSIEQLKSKLNNFTVVDRQGELIGTVRTVAVDDNRQLNLVVFHLSPTQISRLCLLPSKLIQKVDAPNKAILVNFNKTEIEYLPEYKTPETSIIEPAKSSIVPLNIASGEADEGTAEDGSSSPKDIQEQSNKATTLEFTDIPDVLSGEIIRLLGERVVIDRNKRKVGEVVVRKEIGIRTIQVEIPVRYEKLIVEQVSPEYKQLAEIDLGQEEVIVTELLEKARVESEIARLDNLA